MTISNYNVICDIEYELCVARQKFPGNEHKMNALTEEVGELAQALLRLEFESKGAHEQVYQEAIQVAAMAIRVATEGDSTFPSYDPESGYRGKKWEGYKSGRDINMYRSTSHSQKAKYAMRGFKNKHEAFKHAGQNAPPRFKVQFVSRNPSTYEEDWEWYSEG